MSRNDFSGPIVIDTSRHEKSPQQPNEWTAAGCLTQVVGVSGVIVFIAVSSAVQESCRHQAPGESNSAATTPTLPQKTEADRFEESKHLALQQLSDVMNRDKQKVFNSMHPVGEAEDIVVHDIQLSTGEGGEPLALIRYSVNWKGPLTINGYTKALLVFDLESQRVTRNQILSTNGVTNEQAGELFLDVAKAVMDEAVRQSQMEAERRYRGY